MGNNGMGASSWIVLECLVVLFVLGLASFFCEPKYALGVGMVLTAVISLLNNTIGTKAGAKMPEQPGDPKAGQSSTSTVTTEAPPQ